MGRALALIVGFGLLGMGAGVATSIAVFDKDTMAAVLAGFALSMGGALVGSAFGWWLSARVIVF